MKVGDRIRVKPEFNTMAAGTTGTIIKIDRETIFWCADEEYQNVDWGIMADCGYVEQHGLNIQYIGKRIGTNYRPHFEVIETEPVYHASGCKL